MYARMRGAGKGLAGVEGEYCGVGLDVLGGIRVFVPTRRERV